MNRFKSYIHQNQTKFLNELKTFCAQPSISATGEGISEMAQLVRQALLDLGATVQTLDISPQAAPVLYATIGQGERTLLIYNHYDVQPVDPLDLWETPPFEPTVRDGKLFARGVADNKGHLVGRLQALEAWLATMGELPCRIHWFIEGDEEVGSPHLPAFCEEHGHLFKADGCLWEMGNVDEAGNPQMAIGAKGLAYFELSLQCLSGDQHSSLATLAPNAAWRLVWALSSLKAPDERILIDGFMEHVAPPSEADLHLLAAIPFDEADRLNRLGIDGWLGGLTGQAALQRHIFQPTCTICGIESGYTGEGSKTVLPAKAKAKVGFRLVPNLDPLLVADLLRRHLDQQGFADITVAYLGGEHPAKSDPQTAVVTAAMAAAKQVYNLESPAVYPMMAGSGPMWPIAVAHGTPVVVFGVGYNGMNLHAPNENLRLSDYFKGIEMVGQFLAEFGGIATETAAVSSSS